MRYKEDYVSIKDAGYKVAALLSETKISQSDFLRVINHEKMKIDNEEMRHIFELTAIYPNDLDFIDYLRYIGTNKEQKKKEELDWPDEVIEEKKKEEIKYKLSVVLDNYKELRHYSEQAPYYTYDEKHR